MPQQQQQQQQAVPPKQQFTLPPLTAEQQSVQRRQVELLSNDVRVLTHELHLDRPITNIGDAVSRLLPFHVRAVSAYTQTACA
jgi:hypothetical protein